MFYENCITQHINHLCFNSLWPSLAIWLQTFWATLVLVIICCLICTKSLPKPIDYSSVGPLGTIFNEIYIKYKHFHSRKCILKTSSAKRQPFNWDLNLIANLLCYYMYQLSCDMAPPMQHNEYMKYADSGVTCNFITLCWREIDRISHGTKIIKFSPVWCDNITGNTWTSRFRGKNHAIVSWITDVELHRILLKLVGIFQSFVWTHQKLWIYVYWWCCIL